ncbi:hypothetical protein Thpro_021286 [Acidihalobacter prosperus]|uniref:Uncharacterized protein n=1 Tax=Acidihalobacter prosperus TaxID=160660 RepID=A0A1A6C6P8_9GAMM|nr:hypothetical protein Thpro_021286 [Acidihalobacter prosperus]
MGTLCAIVAARHDARGPVLPDRKIPVGLTVRRGLGAVPAVLRSDVRNGRFSHASRLPAGRAPADHKVFQGHRSISEFAELHPRRLSLDPAGASAVRRP